MQLILNGCKKVFLVSRTSHHAVLMGTTKLDDSPEVEGNIGVIAFICFQLITSYRIRWCVLLLLYT